jgi:DNA polymerase-3 subunit delta'
LPAYDDIIGQRRKIEQLERARENGRVAHAYLFFGPDGVGKERVAFAFARALNCASETDAPCGVCESCKKIGKFAHPDVRLVASEKELVDRELIEKEKGRLPSVQIKNAQLDELSDLFRHRPYLGPWKVVIVVDAHLMNSNSQNRFLKTLEEPSADSVIILVTAHPEGLLPTVRSRCQALAFGPLSTDQVANFLRTRLSLDEERARVLAAMAQGSLGRAEAIAQGDILEDRDGLVEGFSRALGGDLADVLAVAEEYSKGPKGREVAQDALNLLEIWCRDLLLCKLGVSADLLVNQDRREVVVDQAAGLSSRRLLEWIENIRRTRSGFRVNANPKMAMESLFLGMRAN